MAKVGPRADRVQIDDIVTVADGDGTLLVVREKTHGPRGYCALIVHYIEDGRLCRDWVYEKDVLVVLKGRG